MLIWTIPLVPEVPEAFVVHDDPAVPIGPPLSVNASASFVLALRTTVPEPAESVLAVPWKSNAVIIQSPAVDELVSVALYVLAPLVV